MQTTIVAKPRLVRCFNGRNIVITGASQGIGRAIANELCANGANLLMVARRQETLCRARNELVSLNPQGRFDIFACDIGKPDEVDKLVDHVASNFQRIDGLINNAGIVNPGRFEQIPPNQIEEEININLLHNACYPQIVTLYPRRRLC